MAAFIAIFSEFELIVSKAQVRRAFPSTVRWWVGIDVGAMVGVLKVTLGIAWYILGLIRGRREKEIDSTTGLTVSGNKPATTIPLTIMALS